MYYFCTYFDRNYLYKGLALYRSLTRHINRFKMWILCFDEDTYNALAKLELPQINLISINEFEMGDYALLKAKQDRNRVEYYWTCTPSLPLYILKRNPEVDVITYLDADLYFYADPYPIYEEFGNNSILIIEHRFGPGLSDLKEENGVYNVGWLSFRRDKEGLSCLHWWRERCLEWCYARKEDNKSGDQKYLEDWPSRFSRVVILQHKGAGLAPWNVHNYQLTKQGNRLMVDSNYLVFYHFQGFDMHMKKIFVQYPAYGLTKQNVRLLYPKYIKELQNVEELVQEVMPDFEFRYAKNNFRSVLSGLRNRRQHWIFKPFKRREVMFVFQWIAPLPDRYYPKLHDMNSTAMS